MDLVGTGRVKFLLTIEGLTDEDWNHLEKVEAQIHRPSGQVDYIPAGEIKIDKDNRRVEFVYSVEEPGIHIVPLRLTFASPSGEKFYQTTYKPYQFRVVDYWK